MKEQELLEICRSYKNNNKFVSIDNWTAEVYSFGTHIRKYGFFPSFLPLNIYTDHSPAMTSDGPAPHELKSKSAVQFYHNYEMVKKFKKISKKPCFTLYSPFVFYRKKNGIKKSVDASGTIAFPAHSTEAVRDVSDIDIYIDQLKSLTIEFQPVSICLHMHDINNGKYKKFYEAGFDVYCAGNINDNRFAERFYEIISKFKYSTSNLIGSYAFYCIEMNIPFFLYGNKPKYFNEWDENLEKGEYSSYENYEDFKNLVSLFNKISFTITEQQIKITKSKLGIDNGLSRFKMFLILYYAMFIFLFNKINQNLFDIIKFLKRKSRPIRRKILNCVK